jgi:hypothetical protein
VCDPTLTSGSWPAVSRVTLAEGQVAAAKATAQDNKGAGWSVAVAVGLQVGQTTELPDNLVALFWDLETMPISTIGDMFNLAGRQVRDTALVDPISLFACLCCDEPLPVRDRKDHKRPQAFEPRFEGGLRSSGERRGQRRRLVAADVRTRRQPRTTPTTPSTPTFRETL